MRSLKVCPAVVLALLLLVTLSASACGGSSASETASSLTAPIRQAEAVATAQAVRVAVAPPAQVADVAAVEKSSFGQTLQVSVVLPDVPDANVQELADVAVFEAVRAWYTAGGAYDACNVLVYNGAALSEHLRLDATEAREDADAIDWQAATPPDLHSRITDYRFSP